MKTTKILGILLIIVLSFSSCKQPEMGYTQASAEIETVKADWVSLVGHFADTAKIYQNA